MWIVRLALRRPYTFVVLAVLIFIAGPLAILRTPTDIFPNINIPVVSIVWTYNGFSAQDMANRITSNYERALTSDVDDIEHIESQSLNGVSVVKIFFHPGADINRAIAEAASNSASILRVLPPGTLPPNIITYNASTVPILQLGLSSNTLSEQQLYDLGNSQIRTQLATVQGASVPLPFGGKVRQIMVDIDPRALQAKGLAPLDVVNAVNAQNLILPGGTAKIGTKEYNVQMNGSTDTVAALNDLPIKTVAGGVVYVRDVAHVRDGYAPQTNIVRSDGKRAALLTIEKSGSTSTLTIIQQVKSMLPHIAAGLPSALHITALSDQSVFVKSAVVGVAREALIAAALTAVMILLFLGSWRATLIIAVSIPLAVLTSLIALSALGQTINIMTLGGLALAVGILVDDATVAIENITHHLENGEPLYDAILNGSGEIAVPTFVSTLSICIVFVPMFLLSGVARYLFVPLAEAVVFAMIASYFFSRTLVPTLAMYLMRARSNAPVTGNGPIARLIRFQAGFEHRFELLRERYRGVLAAAIASPRRFIAIFLLLCLGSLALVPFAGRDFFPAVDTGEIRLHLRAPTGTRIEDTASITDQVEARVRDVIPKQQLAAILDNIGVPVSGINLTYDSSDPIGPEDADVMITLAPKHKPTAQYVATLRTTLTKDFPGVTFAFLPADIVSQILNFGLPAPIDIQIVGNKLDANRAVANRLLAQLRGVRGLVDARIQQPGDAPAINVNVDRTRAIQAGLLQRDVSQNLLIALSGSSQTSPNFWLDPHNGVSYPLMAMMPQYDINSLQALANIPVAQKGGATSPAAAASFSASGAGPAPQNLLGALSTLTRGTQQAVVSHYNVQPVLDIFASVQGRDLGGVAADVNRLVEQIRPQLPPGASIVVRGQVQAMHDSFSGLASGLVFAIGLVYLLMVVNFQSWLDPFIIISGLPGSLAGIAWMLFSTGTRLSVPALTGTILCIGIATANSILVINTAREAHQAGQPPLAAALEAGFSRFRPVLMTALAMLIGMLPMALGLGDGGEQNAPLGRAVIGGLALGTMSTLLFVPVVYGMVHAWLDKRRAARSEKKPNPPSPPAPFDFDETYAMNDSSLQPGLGEQPPKAVKTTHTAHAGAAHPAPEPDPHAKPRRRLWPFALGGLAVALLIAGIVPRLHASAALTEQTQAQSMLVVSVVKPRPAPSVNELLLPGSVMPFAEASIYARTSGYLAHWNTDIGTQVKSGQVLATIEAPDLDAQLRQARADEATAQANFDYAKTTAQRWEDMLKTQSVAQQDADAKVSDMEARRAMLASAQANVAHLAELVSYEKITAPFDGVITARNVDVGALVTAGGTPGTAGMSGELFHIQQNGVLRVFVDVPQNDAPYVTPATGVYLSAQQYPGRRIPAKVARSTGSIDPSSRTLRVEVDVDNKDGALMPGAYTQVHLQLQSATPALDVPVSALLFRPDGVTVAVVDSNGRAVLKTVHIGRDFGTHVEITTGLAATDRVIDNPSDSLSTGQMVQIMPAMHG